MNKNRIKFIFITFNLIKIIIITHLIILVLDKIRQNHAFMSLHRFPFVLILH